MLKTIKPCKAREPVSHTSHAKRWFVMPKFQSYDFITPLYMFQGIRFGGAPFNINLVRLAGSCAQGWGFAKIVSALIIQPQIVTDKPFVSNKICKSTKKYEHLYNSTSFTLFYTFSVLFCTLNGSRTFFVLFRISNNFLYSQSSPESTFIKVMCL